MIITCATCRYGKTTCQHVNKLIHILNDSEDLPQVLLPYAEVYNQLNKKTLTCKKECPILTCLSTKKTPFHLPPNLSTILSQSVNERFNVTDGIALLYPDDSEICVCCGQSNWMRDPDMFMSAKVVTTNSFIPAKGECFIIDMTPRTFCCYYH